MTHKLGFSLLAIYAYLKYVMLSKILTTMIDGLGTLEQILIIAAIILILNSYLRGNGKK